MPVRKKCRRWGYGEVAEAVGRLWEVVIREMGPESDFTSAIKPIEKAAGVVGGKAGHAAK